MSITLFEFAPTRSSRTRWTLSELDLKFDSVAGREVIGSDALKQVHPLGKVPAILDQGRPLFESAAICVWLADSHPEKRLIAPAGTWQRALHDQWIGFSMTEIEAHLWSSFRNTVLYPEDKRVPQIIEQNTREARRSLAVLDRHLANQDFLVDNRFSVTDILVGHVVNWARRDGLTTEFGHLRAYNQRLLAMPKCPYAKE